MPKERARTSGSAESVKTFLQNYVGPESASDAEKTRYFYRFVALSGGQKEVVIYLTGQSWCGSGGCTTLILAPEGSSYRVVGKIPITRLPIRSLSSTTNRWHDISVFVAGGGIQPGYSAKLSFDGQSYPDNPSVPPAQRLRGKPKGAVIVPSNAKGLPLYP